MIKEELSANKGYLYGNRREVKVCFDRDLDTITLPKSDFEEILQLVSKYEEPTTRGRWEFYRQNIWSCSVCGTCYHFCEEWNYCPNCGSEMKKEEIADIITPKVRMEIINGCRNVGKNKYGLSVCGILDIPCHIAIDAGTCKVLAEKEQKNDT